MDVYNLWFYVEAAAAELVGASLMELSQHLLRLMRTVSDVCSGFPYRHLLTAELNTSRILLLT